MNQFTAWCFNVWNKMDLSIKIVVCVTLVSIGAILVQINCLEQNERPLQAITVTEINYTAKLIQSNAMIFQVEANQNEMEDILEDYKTRFVAYRLTVSRVCYILRLNQSWEQRIQFMNRTGVVDLLTAFPPVKMDHDTQNVTLETNIDFIQPYVGSTIVDFCRPTFINTYWLLGPEETLKSETAQGILAKPGEAGRCPDHSMLVVMFKCEMLCIGLH